MIVLPAKTLLRTSAPTVAQEEHRHCTGRQKGRVNSALDPVFSTRAGFKFETNVWIEATTPFEVMGPTAAIWFLEQHISLFG